MEKTNDRRRLTMTIGCFLLYGINGCIETLKGPTLPGLLEEAKFNYSFGGTIVLASYFGYMLASLLCGFAVERVGKKTIAVLSGLFLSLGAVGIAGAETVAAYLAASFILGLGSGAVQVAGNYIIVDMQPRKAGRYLNLLSSCFGVGSMATPYYANLVMSSGLSWRYVYLYSLTVTVFILVYFLVFRYPSATAAPGEPAPGLRDVARIAASRKLLWFYCIVFAYVAAEIGVGTWLIEYLRKAREMTEETAAWHLSLFYGGILIGRFCGGFIVDRLGHVRMLAIAAGGGFSCLVLGLGGPTSWTFFFPLTGLFISVTLPTATAMVAGIQKNSLGAILGVLFCFNGLGGMTGPWLVGIVNDVLGLRYGLGVSAGFCLLILVALRKVHIMRKAGAI